MSRKVSTNISLDPEVKKQAQELFADFGMDLSTAINIFLRQAIRENAIPFTISRDVPNEITAQAIRSDEIYGPYDSISDLMEALNA